MIYKIKAGAPIFKSFLDNLILKASQKSLKGTDKELFKKISKVFKLLEANPRHNSLNSHEIDPLSRRASKVLGKKVKIFESYLENRTPAAGRIFWLYGNKKGEITIVGLEPHPEDKKRDGYDRVNLSLLP